MSTLEKLAKALEALKITHSSTTAVEESNIRTKEKISLCVLVADMICSPEARLADSFSNLLSYSMETLFKMCEDQDSNIRMIADECLNRIIRIHMHTNMGKVNLELHKEIKRNGSARSLRAALWRFAELAHMIRPQKGKPNIQSLVSCIILIASREEESVLETLASSIPKIMAALGCFMSDTEVKELLQMFMKNIHSENTVLRRTAANSILGVCLNCQKSQVFVVYTLSTLLDQVLPLKDNQSTYTILGVLNCIRGLLGHLETNGKETFLRGSFGARKRDKRQARLSTDSIIQVYELCLYWTHHLDHNVVTAALETLNELLSSPPSQLLPLLLSNTGFGRSRISVASASSGFKMSSGTLSELSVSATSAPLEDPLQLLEAEEVAPTTNLTQWLHDNGVNQNIWSSCPGQSLYGPPVTPTLPFGSRQADTQESESEASEDAGLFLKAEPAALSPEPDVFLPPRDSPSPPPLAHHIMTWDIGSATESGEAPLIYCARRLVSAFLIPECSNSRISVRALAISCLTQVLRLTPTIFFVQIDKQGASTPQGFSHVSDVLCYTAHSDPQLRGLMKILIGNLINSMYNQGIMSENVWLKSKNLSLAKLLDILIQGLEDDSSVSIRHSLSALTTCLTNIMESADFLLTVPILEKLISLVNNPYWLVKVKLVELLSNIPYQTIYFVTGSCSYQSNILDSIVLKFLGNEDSRLRKVIAKSIVKLIQNLYFPSDYVKSNVLFARCSKIQVNMFAKIIDNQTGQSPENHCDIIENTLCRIVTLLTEALLVSSSKHLTFGCIEALSLLSEEYPAKEYPLGWHFNISTNESESVSCGIFPYIVTMLTSSSTAIDLESHQWLLKLAGNLYFGIISHLNQNHDRKSKVESIKESKLVVVAEELLVHLVRLVAIFVRVITDEGSQSKSSGPSPLRRKSSRAASPTKLPSAETKEVKKLGIIGQFANNSQCMKLDEIVSSGYSNYKLTLDSAASEKFLSLIHETLNCLEHLFSRGSVIDSSNIAEELLPYLTVTFILDSTATIRVVNQLMRSLFEHTLLTPVLHAARPLNKDPDLFYLQSHNLDEEKKSLGHFYDELSRPLVQLSDHFRQGHRIRIIDNKKEQEVLNALPKCDVVVLAQRIKLFEGIVIQSLQEYTTTNNVKLQVQVLALLTQLVQLKVNYCLLDSDQIFIRFVKNQFEYLEAGQIHHAELLIPQIFKFLVHLSNEKNHTKPVINVPEIIQLCDRLMASGQNPVTHCIPALIPVAEHVFLINPTQVQCCGDQKELETQREVVLAMMVRLVEYPQMLDILYKVMEAGWRWEDHWQKWYRQSVDSILPLLAEGKLLVNDFATLHALFSLNSKFTVPLNSVLILLFTHQEEGQSVFHWLSMVTTMLMSVCMYPEESVLLQLEEMNLYVKEEGDDPLKVNTLSNTLPPHFLIAKLILRVIIISIKHLNNLIISFNEEENVNAMQKTLGTFLLCCGYMVGGSFEKVSKSLNSLLETSEELKDVNKAFLAVINKLPCLALRWTHILMALSLNVQHWAPLLEKKSFDHRTSFNLELVKEGNILFYCDCLARRSSDQQAILWFLREYIEEVIWNCYETPVHVFLCSIFNSEAKSKIFIDFAADCTSFAQPVFAHRLLYTLEFVHSRYIGQVLKLVANTLVEHRYIAIARLAIAFCNRTIEFMMTLDKQNVLAQLSPGEFAVLVEKIKNHKHLKRQLGLLSLLDKLGEQYYELERQFDCNQAVDAGSIRSVRVDKSWLLNQIKEKCSKTMNTNGRKCARLLSKLDTDDLQLIVSSDSFDIAILQHCFALGAHLSLKKKAIIKDNFFENLVPLFTSARHVLLSRITSVCECLPQRYQAYTLYLDGEAKDKMYSINLHNIFVQFDFKEIVLPLVNGLTNFLISFNNVLNVNESMANVLPKKYWLNVTRFGLLCAELINWLLCTSELNIATRWPSTTLTLLECTAAVFSFDVLSSLLSLDQIASVCDCLFNLFTSLTAKHIYIKQIKVISDPKDKLDSANSWINTALRMASLIHWIENQSMQDLEMPQNIYESMRIVIVSIGRNEKINWVSKIPVEAWQFPLNREIPAPIPMPLLHDSDVLNQIVYRIKLLGWTGRHQFEETWVSLLSSLSPNPDIDNTDQEEMTAIMQANSLAVDGITWLILSTLARKTDNLNNQALLHIPRLNSDKIFGIINWKRLVEMNKILCWKMRKAYGDKNFNLIRIDKRPNLERVSDASSLKFGIGQISVSHLQTQLRFAEEDGYDYGTIPSHEVDIRSCLQFVLDLFGQWVLPSSGITLNLQLSMAKSIVCLSDMFTERAHYEWMLSTFLEISKNHPQHDEIMHQYLILGVSKAAAVLNIFEGERSDRIIKLVELALKSSFAPMRSSGIHSLLYLLQSVLNVKKSESLEMQKSSQYEFRQKVVQISVDFIKRYFIQETIDNYDDVVLLIALVMYMLECYSSELGSDYTITKTITHLVKYPSSRISYLAVMQGLERIVLIGEDNDLNEQIIRLASDRFSHADPLVSLPALQLLIACIYKEKQENNCDEVSGETEHPTKTMEMMEKATVLFDKIRKGYPIEVEVVCEILPCILSDFFSASDILTKVIGEFLSPNQPHKKDMAGMVFQVFTQACSEHQLPLLQDWVVHSLNNFTQNVPTVSAVWCLCCFFICASDNPWLKAIFPHVQSRIRQCEFEDRELLCIAATSFYNQLNSDQQEIFLQSFEEICGDQKHPFSSPFSEIISCV
ncbi:huntingtin isoform X3 [Rhodnius prolixus]|uniref:huntingtin isoform X3 n=1 Tax=Rhodnius prolixus TaxID=13249 RepID=UPI003D188070